MGYEPFPSHTASFSSAGQIRLEKKRWCCERNPSQQNSERPQATLGYFRATSFMQKPFRCRLQWSPYQFEYWEIRINRNPNLSLKHKRKGGKYDKWFHYALPSWPSWIWKPIKKQKITSFAEDGAVVKRTTKGVIEEIKMERDLMRKLLMISLKGKLDIGIFLTLSVNSGATCIL